MVSELNAEIELPAGNGAASAARRALRAILSGWDLTDEDWMYDATLIASELVTNAIRHGGGCLSLKVHAEDGAVLLSVADRSTQVPHRRHSDERTTGGRGLTFVDAFAQSWGFRPLEDGENDGENKGKQVWVRLEPYPG